MTYILLILNILFSAILIANIYFYRKTERMLEQNKQVLDIIEESERVKLTVEMWNSYIWELEESEKFELCDIIKRHIHGKGEYELVDPPEGFKVWKDANNPTIYFVEHPKK
jgi:hypothetical protein